MKKIFFTFILFILSITITNAASCVVISGDGTQVGDEIKCGTEYFYVISNNGTDVKMLGKYNLMAGSSYDYLPLDNYTISNNSEIYLHPEVRKKLESGYTIWRREYTYDSTKGTYTYTGIYFMDYYDEDDKTIYFDTPYENRSDVIKDSKVVDLLNKGYTLGMYIIIEDKYYGITMYNYNETSYKTIFFDETNRSLGDVLRSEEVKKLIDQGYGIENRIYTNASTTTGEYLYDFSAVIFFKNEYNESENIIFEENITSKDEFDSYIANNNDIQDKLANGYGYTTYSSSVYDSTSKTYTYNYYGIRLSTSKKSTFYQETKQDKLAIGIHGEAGKPEYPFYGIVADDYELMDYADDEERFIGDIYSGYFQDLNLEEQKYYRWYKKTLEEMGYPVKSVTALSVQELSKVIKDITGNEIPLQNWYENKTYIEDADSYLLGSIKNLLGDKHQWLYSTAYWLRTRPTDIDRSLFDISTLGDLCASDICKTEPTTGLRPLVTIAVKDIDYSIKTKTDGNGTVTAIEKSKSGEEITFTVKPKIGYTLKEVKVTDADGNVIVFKDNTFTMPTSNVLIEATFEVKNPNTIAISTIACFIFTIVSFVIYKKYNNKINWLNN